MKSLPRMAHLTAVLLMSLAAQSCTDRGDAIAAARGDWLYINYWATWCKPCRREVPELNALNKRTGYAVLGVNYDGTLGEALAAEERDLAITFPTLTTDPAQRYQVERPQVLPTTLVITPAGELAQVLVGPQTEESLLAATRSGDQ